jgi:hypothetical protein
MQESLQNLIRDYNRNTLKQCVNKVTCIYAGGASFSIPDSADFSMPDYFLNYKISSVEVYENGAVNAYCRSRADGRLFGYIIIR